MARFGDFLPIGSVVLLKNGRKKVVIMGVMPSKRTADGKMVLYDYLGVPYPEGYMGAKTGLLFRHDDISEVIFTGYTNEERDIYSKVLSDFLTKTEAAINDGASQFHDVKERCSAPQTEGP